MEDGNLKSLFVVLLFIISNILAFASVSGNDNGRGEVQPPSSGTEWEIIEQDAEINVPREWAGNITIKSGATLVIKSGATLKILWNESARWTFTIKQGGTLEIRGGAKVYLDHFYAEEGTSIRIMERAYLHATEKFVVNGGSISIGNDSYVGVFGIDGSKPEQSGTDAELILNGSEGASSIQQATLEVVGGNGAKGMNGHPGGNGGNATLLARALIFSRCTIDCRGGKGGDGGEPGGTTANGGRGGNGGKVTAYLYGGGISESNITLHGGDGGKGKDGLQGSGTDGGNGGDGGSGGGVLIFAEGSSMDIISSTIRISGGKGGESGAGGPTHSQGKNGGNGGRGGNGGSVSLEIKCDSVMKIENSEINTTGGVGPGGGNYGKSFGGGRDGDAGKGGNGGGARVSIKLQDSFVAKNSKILAVSGGGGTGGMGSYGGEGGKGGSSTVEINVEAVSTEAEFTFTNGEIISIGGSGGNGGKGLSSGDIVGTWGNGGDGGKAFLFITASKEIDIDTVPLICRKGDGGTTEGVAKEGEDGYGDIQLNTNIFNGKNSLITETIDTVDNSDVFKLYDCLIDAQPQFVTNESGTIEIYYSVIINTVEYGGGAITDGSVTVEIYKNDSLIDQKRSDDNGKANFDLLRFKGLGGKIISYEYVASAYDDRGRNSTKVKIAPTSPGKKYNVIIYDKPYPPEIVITQPDVKLTPVINAMDYEGITYKIEGEAKDNDKNPEAFKEITEVQIKIGEDGEWMKVPFEETEVKYRVRFHYDWKILKWAKEQAEKMPGETSFQCFIYARAFNGKYWSDDTIIGGKDYYVNITVQYVEIPPEPPLVDIVQPTISTSKDKGSIEVPYDEEITFDARVNITNGTKVIKWKWDFDGDGKIDYESPESPKATYTYPKDMHGQYMNVILYVIDNESQRRLELKNKGVHMEYIFDYNTGGSRVELTVRVKQLPPEKPPELHEVILQKYGWLIAFTVVFIGVSIAGIGAARYRRKKLKEKKEKELEEILKVEVEENICERCGEILSEPGAACKNCAAMDVLQAVQETLLNIKSKGVSITEAETLHEDAVDAYDAKSYDEAMEKARLAQQKAYDLERRHSEIAAEISKWETEVQAAKLEMPEANLEDAENKVYHARLALGRGDYEGALKQIEDIDIVIKDAKKVGEKKAYEEMIQTVKRMLTNVKNRGVILDKKIDEIIKEADEAFSHNKLKDVESICKKVEKSIRDANKQFMRAGEQLRKCEIHILNAKGMGEDVGRADELLVEAKDAMSRGAYLKAIELGTNIMNVLGITVPKPRPKPKKVDWEKEAARLTGVAPPPKKKPKIVIKEEKEIPSPPPEEVKVELMSDAEKEIKICQEAIKKAKELAIDTTDGEEILEDAKRAFIAKRYEMAMEYAKNARFLLETLISAAEKPAKPRIIAPRVEKVERKIDEEARTEIDKLRELVKECEHFGIDVSTARDGLNQAERAISSEAYDMAVESAKNAYKMLKDMKEKYMMAEGRIRACEKKIESARDSGIDVSEFERKLESIRSTLMGGAYERVVDMCVSLDKSMDESIAALSVRKEKVPVISVRPKVPAKIPCPNCGKEIKSTWKTCPYCGKTVKIMNKCPNCERDVKPTWKICPSCGAKLGVEEEKVCGVCGAKLKPKWKTCPVCGTKVVEKPAEKPKIVIRPVKKQRDEISIEKQAYSTSVEDIRIYEDEEKKVMSESYDEIKEEKTYGKTEEVKAYGEEMEASQTYPKAPAPTKKKITIVMPRCPSCGKDVKEKWTICPYCGGKLK